MERSRPGLRRAIEERLIAQASQSEQFAAALRRDPRAAVQREMTAMGVDMTLPADLTIDIIEETPQKLYVVLPRKRLQDDGALSDADLERVSGGTFCICL
jgi:hypothetical protein